MKKKNAELSRPSRETSKKEKEKKEENVYTYKLVRVLFNKRRRGGTFSPRKY